MSSNGSQNTTPRSPISHRRHQESEEKFSNFREVLPQILAVTVKNVLLFGYGMTLGFPTIVIPAIQGGEGREPTQDDRLLLNKDEISWFSESYPHIASLRRSNVPSLPFRFD